VLTAAACATPGPGQASRSGAYAGVELETPKPKPDFVLTDTAGERYDFGAETEGKLTLLYFGYTHCPDICPVHLAQLADVLDRDRALARETVVVFVSVDPMRDTPAVLRDFLDKFDPEFVGLTGTSEELETAQQAAGVAVAQILDDSDDYLVGHAGQVIAYAPDGWNYTIYPFGTRQSDYTHDLPLLVKRTNGT